MRTTAGALLAALLLLAPGRARSSSGAEGDRPAVTAEEQEIIDNLDLLENLDLFSSMDEIRYLPFLSQNEEKDNDENASAP